MNAAVAFVNLLVDKSIPSSIFYYVVRSFEPVANRENRVLRGDEIAFIDCVTKGGKLDSGYYAVASFR